MTTADAPADDGGDDERTDSEGVAGRGRLDRTGETGGGSPVRRRRFLAAVGAAAAVGLAGCEETVTETPGDGTQPEPTETEGMAEVSTRAPDYEEVTPEMAVDGYEIALFSDFMDLAREVGADVDLNAFDALVADGSRGFEPGLYVSIGPAIREVINDSFEEAPRIVYVDREGRARPFVSGEFGVETMTWAEGDYGDGILFTKPHTHQIARARPDGSVETLAEDVGGSPEESPGPFPLGPAGLTYGPDERLFVTNYFGTELLRVSPDGEVDNPVGGKLAIPQPTKAVLADPDGQFGGEFLVGTFSLDPPRSDALYSVALDREGEAEEIVGGVTGMEVVSRGPDGTIYVPSAGPDQPATGSVQRLTAGGELAPFVEQVDAAHVAVDADGVVGDAGGMFLTDFTNKGGSGRVFEIRPQ